MPDHFGIGQRALKGLRNEPQMAAATSLIDMPIGHAADDSLRAAQHLRDAGAGCIIVLGGDGTCRIVSKACGQVPLLPVSTGTNNVVPHFIEGTVAGSAAAFVALQPESERYRLCRRHKRLVVHLNGRQADQALVEVTVLSARFVGARAIWETGSLRQLFVSRAQPFSIGLSTIIGVVQPVEPTHPGGAAVTIVPNGRKVRAPIAPGSFVEVGIGPIVDLVPGIRHPVAAERPAILAFDGERELSLYEGDEAEVALELDGPWIVDVRRTLETAVAAGAFLE